MIENVFRPSRRIDGKRVRADYYYGRYTLPPNPKIFTVPLNTPDKDIARKRLRDIILEKQREAEGLIAPRALRETAIAGLAGLFEEYKQDLTARGLAPNHIRDTYRRLVRMANEAKWKALSDIKPDSFVKWRSTLQGSAKTIKEYQTSINAFLNWLVSLERLAANPLGKLEHIDIRGKQVRQSRAFTEDELKRLFAVAGRRLPAYLMLLYTGQREGEVRALVWGDLHLQEEQPYVLIREATTKDKDKRAIPLHAHLAAVLREMKPEHAKGTDSVFYGRFPTYESLRADLVRAGIEHTDSLGRVVHFHAFRKTWQTMGVRYGINQRAAQEVLGHSDPALTAKVYTDVAGLQLHAEVAKLPWLVVSASPPAGAIASTESNAQPNAHEAVVQRQGMSLPVTNNARQSLDSSGISPLRNCSSLVSASVMELLKMVVGSGFEPTTKEGRRPYHIGIKPLEEIASAQPCSQGKAAALAALLRSWEVMSPEDRQTLLQALEGVEAAP